MSMHKKREITLKTWEQKVCYTDVFKGQIFDLGLISLKHLASSTDYYTINIKNDLEFEKSVISILLFRY